MSETHSRPDAVDRLSSPAGEFALSRAEMKVAAVLGAASGPATAAELEGEAAAVATFVTSYDWWWRRSQRGAAMRRRCAAAVVAVGLFTAGTAAAALETARPDALPSQAAPAASTAPSTTRVLPSVAVVRRPDIQVARPALSQLPVPATTAGGVGTSKRSVPSHVTTRTVPTAAVDGLCTALDQSDGRSGNRPLPLGAPCPVAESAPASGQLPGTARGVIPNSVPSVPAAAPLSTSVPGLPPSRN